MCSRSVRGRTPRSECCCAARVRRSRSRRWTDRPAMAQRLWEETGDRPRPRALDTLGYELLALDAEAGTAEAAFTVGEAFGNTVGNVQGGFLAAMLDATCVTAIVCTLEPGEIAPMVELKISYLRPARIGRLVGRGRIIKRGSRVA